MIAPGNAVKSSRWVFAGAAAPGWGCLLWGRWYDPIGGAGLAAEPACLKSARGASCLQVGFHLAAPGNRTVAD